MVLTPMLFLEAPKLQATLSLYQYITAVAHSGFVITSCTTARNLQTVLLYGAGPPPTLQLAQQSKLALYNHTTILFTINTLKQRTNWIESLIILVFHNSWVNLGFLVGCSLGHAPSWYQQQDPKHGRIWEE